VTARRATAALAAAALLGGGAVSGCGNDPASKTVVQEPSPAVGPPSGPDATLPTTTTPPSSTSTSTDTNPTATTGEPTTTSTAPNDTGGTPAGGEQGPGGAGDEEPARVPVALTADGGSLSPTTVTLPAFLAVEITVTAKGGAEQVTVSAPGGGAMAVPAGGKQTMRLGGLQPGAYSVTTAGGGKTLLRVVSGGAAGP
jgi:hypothetical protein